MKSMTFQKKELRRTICDKICKAKQSVGPDLQDIPLPPVPRKLTQSVVQTKRREEDCNMQKTGFEKSYLRPSYNGKFKKSFEAF